MRMIMRRAVTGAVSPNPAPGAVNRGRYAAP